MSERSLSVLLDQHVGIVGRTGSGKTFLAKLLAETVLRLGRRLCILDPTDAWWGLRTSADGKKPGFPVVVFGGDHADVEINEHSGPALAEFVAEGNTPCIIVTADMMIAERRRFCSEFAETLFRDNRQALTLIVDEADELMPQNPPPEMKVVLHRFDRIVRRGRIRGFRVVMITQRPAVLHKNVLSQASVLVAMRLMAPQDRKAIEAWIEGQGDTAKGKVLLNSLPKLETGEGWVWAADDGEPWRQQFPRITTFDSSRAPGHDDIEEAPRTLAQIDLSDIKARFAEAEEEAAANDPKVLKERIAELERQLGQDVSTTVISGLTNEDVDRARDEGHQLGREAGYREGWNALAEKINEDMRQASVSLQRAWQTAKADTFVPEPSIDPGFSRREPAEADWSGMTTRPIAPTTPPAIPPRKIKQSTGPGEQMPTGWRKILTVLAQYPQGRTKVQVAVLTVFAIGGGGFNNYLGALRTKGWIEGAGENLKITDAGVTALGSFEPLPTGKALRDYWIDRLPKAAASILSVLCSVYPKTLTKEETAERTGYVADAGGFNNALGRLRTMELISGGRGQPLRASDNLF